MRIDKLRESPHWSYSAMQCYLTCPLKYKFRYIDNAEPERTGSCFPFGRSFHAALSERARIGKDMSEREVCDVFEDYFKTETDVAENLVYKANEDYDSMLQIGFKVQRGHAFGDLISIDKVVARYDLGEILKCKSSLASTIRSGNDITNWLFLCTHNR